jgi:hypothetical protein
VKCPFRWELVKAVSCGIQQAADPSRRKGAHDEGTKSDSDISNAIAVSGWLSNDGSLGNNPLSWTTFGFIGQQEVSLFRTVLHGQIEGVWELRNACDSAKHSSRDQALAD